MLASVLDRAVLEPDAAGGHGFVHTAVRLDDLIGVRLEEVESVVDIVRTTAEAEVAAVLKETSPGPVDRRRCARSARSTCGRWPSSSAAAGTGWPPGSAPTGELEDVITKLREALRDPVLLASG